MEYMNASQASEKWGISSRRVAILCEQGRVAGVSKLGKMWLIPKEAVKPSDARIKSGKYIGTRKDKKNDEK